MHVYITLYLLKTLSKAHEDCLVRRHSGGLICLLHGVAHISQLYRHSKLQHSGNFFKTHHLTVSLLWTPSLCFCLLWFLSCAVFPFSSSPSLLSSSSTFFTGVSLGSEVKGASGLHLLLGVYTPRSVALPPPLYATLWLAPQYRYACSACAFLLAMVWL